MKNIKATDKLFELQDLEYRKFHAKLIPTVDKECIIGVRVPMVRKFAKEYIKDEECDSFLKDLPHKYYDENMLHGILLSNIKDMDKCIEKIEDFLPYVDNWAVSDTMSPKVFAKNKDILIIKIKQWMKSNHTYTCRFGIGMLMRFFLDEDFKKEYFDIVCDIKSDEYYVNMMIAWYFATALAKQWDDTINILKEEKLSVWVHNKTIQKACESYRITKEQKKFLKTLKRN